ncbi:MAG: hypothetical protein SVY53_11985 [Chloroflexota bacterium]|nr:hypothetical protein [Chloroflexota bacterium]
MKVYFHENKTQPKEYTLRLLKYLLNLNGISVTKNVSESDCVFVSLCDMTEYPLLVSAKKLGKPIVAGGFQADMPIVHKTADYTCVGEAYDFIRRLAGIKRVEEIADFPQTATANKAAIIDQNIDYAINPVISVTSRAYYYYCGKGCPQHCKFCYLSYQREYQKAPIGYLLAALRQIPSGSKLYPMLSHFDYKIPADMIQKLGILDVRVRDYVRRNGQGYGNRVRTGIEFMRQDYRNKLAKPISTDEIVEFVNLSKKHKCTSVWYFVAGLEGEQDALDFLDKLPVDMSLYPRIICIFTYIEPQPKTPMANFDIRQKKEFDSFSWFFKEAHKKNRRIRVHTPKYLAFSTWKTLMNRASTDEEISFAWSMRNEKDNSHMLDIINSKMPNMLGTMSIADIVKNSRIG